MRAILDGPDGSMATLQRLFDRTDTRIERGTDGQWAVSAPVLDELWGGDANGPLQHAEGGGVPVHRAAADLVRHLNAAGRVEESSYRPVRGTGRYERDGSSTVVVADVGVALEVSAVGSLTVSTGGAPAAPRGPRYLDVAAREPAVRQVLDLVGAPEVLDAFDLWKVLEIVRAHVGGPQPGTATTTLTSSGLLTRAEWDALGDALNNPATSGDAARHARYTRSGAISSPMSLDQARERVLRLVRDWVGGL